MLNVCIVLMVSRLLQCGMCFVPCLVIHCINELDLHSSLGLVL